MGVPDSQTIYRLIRNKYKRMGFSVLEQVRNKPGYRDIRIADALAISQSSLRDTSFIGFEIKVSKSDFRTELANPRKADEIAQFCNKWFVVAPKGVIPVKELPENWGLLEATKTQLRITKEARELPCVPPTREFVAMIMRQVENSKPVEEAYGRGYREGTDHENKWRKESLERRDDELQSLRDSVDTFEKNSGLRIRNWDDDHAKQVGRVVNLIKQEPNLVLNSMKRTEETVSNTLTNIQNAIKELEANPLEGQK